MQQNAVDMQNRALPITENEVLGEYKARNKRTE